MSVEIGEPDSSAANSVVLAVVENRAREICISKLDTNLDRLSELEVYLSTDLHSYVETLSTIADLSPHEILLHDGSRTTVLSRKIEEYGRSHDIRVIHISRQYFDQDRGAELLRKLLVGNIDSDLISKYTVLASTYCLLRYVENCTNQIFSSKSIRLVYSNSTMGGKHMSVDRNTAISLELVINTRKNQLVLKDLQKLLKTCPDFDRTLSGLSMVPKNLSVRSARRDIDTIICLKQICALADDMSNLLRHLVTSRNNDPQPKHTDKSATNTDGSPIDIEDSAIGNALLDTILSALSAPGLQTIRHMVRDAITESTTYSKASHVMRHQECFALRAGINGMLDIARKTYLQTVEDIYLLADTYTEELGLPIKIAFNSSRGYHITVPSTLQPLPAGFIQPVLHKRTISCSSDELASLSTRADEAIGNAFAITQDLLRQTLQHIRLEMEVLFALTDGIALLDMLGGFAALVLTSNQPWCRPVLTEATGSGCGGVLAVQSGRHPVISRIQGSHLASHGSGRAGSDAQQGAAFVPNDCFLGPMENMQVITGANGSGKTVYIKQVALIVICAQIGCFIPARNVSIAVRDRVLSRLGTSDDMEYNLSTFAAEMKDAAFILSRITPHSLVIIDELGRGTSNIDGVSLAFAIAEKLQSSAGSFVLFVTHYPQLTRLAELYSNVRNVHLRTAIELPTVHELHALASAAVLDEAAGSPPVGMRFLHSVATGPCEVQSGYGIMLAEICGFPPALVAEARRIQRVVKDQYPVLVDRGPVDCAGKAIAALLQHLLLLRSSSMDDDHLRRYLANLRAQVAPDLAEHMLSVLSDVSLTSVTPSVTAAVVPAESYHASSDLSSRDAEHGQKSSRSHP